ncbi:transposase IS66 [Caballeronia calidae]|uniref:Transposase IS66 n=1 Tax=Caballeronia calidae TaxID=1777139 RepID=A0A158EKL9_9BURK|nr:transposase IS66 [Caballeronia calidae]
MKTNRPKSSSKDHLKCLPSGELIARILELEDRNRRLVQRVEQLEELFRLAQDKRFAPSSEKLKRRVFDEAEQIAATPGLNEDDEVDDAFALPDTGLPETDRPAPGERGRKPLPAHLPRQRIEYDLPDAQKLSVL